MKRLYEVEVKTTVYVLAESEREAEGIACSQTDADWLRGWAFDRPVAVRGIDHEWRDVPPLRGGAADGDERTCRDIAEAEALAREVAARQAVLPGVACGVHVWSMRHDDHRVCSKPPGHAGQHDGPQVPCDLPREK